MGVQERSIEQRERETEREKERQKNSEINRKRNEIDNFGWAMWAVGGVWGGVSVTEKYSGCFETGEGARVKRDNKRDSRARY